MNDAFYIAGIGLSSQERALGGIANNIANLNTQGFKRSDIRFSDIMAGENGAFRASGVQAREEVQIFERGAIEQTGQALDIAIDGAGFIELLGPEGQSYLWRGGRLRIGPDGFLRAENGMMLRDMINVPLDAQDISIAGDGLVSAVSGEDETAQEIGQLSVVRIDDPSSVDRKSDGYYALNSDAQIRSVDPGTEGSGAIVQGSVERSTVDLNREMVGMMIIQRAYASNAQVLQAADRLMSIANSLRQQ